MSRPTIRDVANLAGVTAMTVSRVINNSDYVKAETRQHVEAAIEALNYVPNQLGKSLRFQETKTIALLVDNLINPFWLRVLQGVESVATGNDFQVIISNPNGSATRQFELLKNLISKQVDGVVLAPAHSELRFVEFARSNEVPVVVMDRHIPAAKVDTVRANSVDAAHRLVKHLIDFGHRKIGVITGPQEVSTAVDRVTGYKNALQEANIPVDESLIEIGQFSIESGYKMAQKMIMPADRPSAICATNNDLAIGALHAAKEANIQIPADLSLATFDFRRPPIFTLEEPFFTMAAFSGYDMGVQATELLLKRIRKELESDFEEIILPTNIVVNRSTAPCRP